jgi:hypothetical protein
MRSTLLVVAHTLLWISFIVAQVTILMEFPLTILALGMAIVLLIQSTRGEFALFFVGVALALVIELGLGLIARSQHWSHASLYGIPYWLPIIWGYGFVMMRRIGNLVVAVVDGAKST